jgi:ribosomal protein L40E
MLENYEDKIVLDCYILNEQPMICGKCGARTSFDEENSGRQMHQCLNPSCGYKFVAVEDDN